VPRSEISRSPRKAAGPSLLFAALLLASEPLRAQTPGPSLVAQRVDQPPRLEDFLASDPPAGGVRVTEFRQREPGDGVPGSVPTTAYVSYDDANLYVVFVCRDDPTKIRAGLTKREEISVDDGVAVYLDTFRDRKRAYLFQANPLGVQLDGITGDPVRVVSNLVDATENTLNQAISNPKAINPDSPASSMAMPSRIEDSP